jgi:hypothetical protein
LLAPPNGFHADQEIGHRCFGASLPMRISASWFGSFGSTAYKDVARLIRATESGLPSDRHPDRIECAAVLRAVKVWPGKGRGRGKVGATANLDSSCARRLLPILRVGAKRRGFQIEQRNPSRKQEREIAALKPLDNEKPIQAAVLALAAHCPVLPARRLSRFAKCRGRPLALACCLRAPRWSHA